ncbi:MAG: GGDEF domain-containing protein, partial [Planctomycetota bacterium]
SCQELQAHVSRTVVAQPRSLESPNFATVHLLITDRPRSPAPNRSTPLLQLTIVPTARDEAPSGWNELSAPAPLIAAELLNNSAEFSVPAGIEAPERLRLLRLLLRQIAQRQTILELYQRWQQAERLAEMDDLTQLPNRRAWWREFPRRLMAARLHHQPLSIVLFDLQQFKQVNDRLGLSVGDQLLGTLARNWQAACRTDEFLARIGGDEFACLLPLVDAESLLMRLRDIVPQITTPQPLAELLPTDVSIAAHSPHTNSPRPILPHLPALRVHWAATPCVDAAASPAELWSIVEQQLMRSKTEATAAEMTPVKKSFEKTQAESSDNR